MARANDFFAGLAAGAAETAAQKRQQREQFENFAKELELRETLRRQDPAYQLEQQLRQAQLAKAQQPEPTFEEQLEQARREFFAKAGWMNDVQNLYPPEVDPTEQQMRDLDLLLRQAQYDEAMLRLDQLRNPPQPGFYGPYSSAGRGASGGTRGGAPQQEPGFLTNLLYGGPEALANARLSGQNVPPQAAELAAAGTGEDILDVAPTSQDDMRAQIATHRAALAGQARHSPEVVRLNNKARDLQVRLAGETDADKRLSLEQQIAQVESQIEEAASGYVADQLFSMYGTADPERYLAEMFIGPPKPTRKDLERQYPAPEQDPRYATTGNQWATAFLEANDQLRPSRYVAPLLDSEATSFRDIASKSPWLAEPSKTLAEGLGAPEWLGNLAQYGPLGLSEKTRWLPEMLRLDNLADMSAPEAVLAYLTGGAVGAGGKAALGAAARFAPKTTARLAGMGPAAARGVARMKVAPGGNRTVGDLFGVKPGAQAPGASSQWWPGGNVPPPNPMAAPGEFLARDAWRTAGTAAPQRALPGPGQQLALPAPGPQPMPLDAYRAGQAALRQARPQFPETPQVISPPPPHAAGSLYGPQRGLFGGGGGQSPTTESARGLFAEPLPPQRLPQAALEAESAQARFLAGREAEAEAYRRLWGQSAANVPSQAKIPSLPPARPATGSNIPGWVQDAIEVGYKQAENAGVIEDIVQMSRSRTRAKNIARQLAKSKRLPSENAYQIVRAVKAKLGIPSYDEPVEFDAWLKLFE